MFQNQTPHLKCHDTTDANGNKNKAYLNWDWKDSPMFFMVFITRDSAFNSTNRCVCVAVAGQKLIIGRQVITLTSQKHKFGAANCCQWDFLKTPLIWFCQSVCMRCWYAPLARPSRLPLQVVYQPSPILNDELMGSRHSCHLSAHLWIKTPSVCWKLRLWSKAPNNILERGGWNLCLAFSFSLAWMDETKKILWVLIAFCRYNYEEKHC